MSIKEIKEQIELLTIIKLLLEIDNRESDWKSEDETHLIELKCKLYNVNTRQIG